MVWPEGLIARNFCPPVHTTFAVCMALSPKLMLPRSAAVWSLLRVAAGRKRRDFDDWIRKLPHRLHENLDDFCVELRIRAAF